MIDIRDGDDLNPAFTQELYTTQIQEDYPITVGAQMSISTANFMGVKVDLNVACSIKKS